jgi:hypothetical protein
MQALELPPALSKEFMTVNAALTSGGPTRTVDALLLSWIKHEEQMRRLFSFLVFQHPALKADESALDEFVDVAQHLAEDATSYVRCAEAAKEIGVSRSFLVKELKAGKCTYRTKLLGTRGALHEIHKQEVTKVVAARSNCALEVDQ